MIKLTPSFLAITFFAHICSHGYTPVGETVGEKFAVGDMDCWRSRFAVGDQSGLLAIFFRSWRSRRTVGDQSGLLAIFFRSWRSRRTVGDQAGLLVIKIRSWRSSWTVGDIQYRQEFCKFSTKND